MAEEVPITSETIRLGQLLKLAGVADSGSDAKALLEHREVRVNGEPDARRGRRLRPGDRVTVAGRELLVCAPDEDRGRGPRG